MSTIEYWSRSATNSMMSFRSAASAKGSLSQLNFSTFHNHVLDPASLQVNRRARRPKTDRIDADRMVRALIRHLRGEPEACSVIRVPSPEQEDARRLHRQRDRLIAERVAHVNRVKGLFATQGIYDYEPLRSDRLKRLEKVRTGGGRDLPYLLCPISAAPQG